MRFCYINVFTGASAENGDFDTVLRNVPVVVDTIIRYLGISLIRALARNRGLDWPRMSKHISVRDVAIILDSHK